MTTTLDRPAGRGAPSTGSTPASPQVPSRYPWSPHRALLLGAVLAVVLLAMDVLVATSHAGLIPAPIRALLGVAGFVLLPGLPLITLVRIPGRSVAAALVISLSLAVNILVTHTAMVVHWWSPQWTQLGLVGVSMALCAVGVAVVPVSPSSVDNGVFARVAWTGRRAASLGALAVSTALFVVAARTLDVDAAGHFGVLSAISPVYVVGLAVLCGTLVATLLSPRVDHLTMALGTTLLIAYNTMLVATATGQTSVPTAFVHRGFVDILVAGRALPQQQDARFSWAGFFSAAAHLVEVTGISGVGGLLAWAPLVFGALLAVPLYAIAIVITGRVRLAWTAVVLYQLFNWYQQDYFAPQSVALIFYATVLATLLWCLRNSSLPDVGPIGPAALGRLLRRTPGRAAGFGPIRTLALGATMLVIVAANTVTHQITPILLIIALGWFSVLGATRYRTLWVAAGLIFAAWFSYGASDFWLGHLQSLFSELGQVGNSVNRGVGQRLSGDPTYKQMQYLRIGASGLFVLIAFVGWLCSWRRRAWLVGGALCASPFLLVALQSYGGEMLIRCFLLASPVLAPFAALALAVLVHRLQPLIRVSGGSRRFVALSLAGLILLAFGLIGTTNRGLNTAFEASTAQEVEVSDRMMAAIPPDSTIMSWSYAPHTVGVRRALDTGGPRMYFIDSFPCLGDIAACAIDRAPDYVYITNQGRGMLRLQYGMSDATLDDVIARTLDSGDYVVDIEEPSILLLRRVEAPSIGMK